MVLRSSWGRRGPVPAGSYFFLAAGPLLFICGDSHGSWKTLGTETLLFPHKAHIFLGLLRAVILPAAPPPIRSRWKLTTNNYAGLCFILEWNYSVYIGLYRPIFLSLPPVPSPLLPGIPSERKFVSWKRGPGEKEEGEKNEVCVHVFVTSICSQK